MPRENILFGLDLDQREYDDALHRSARVPIFFSQRKFPECDVDGDMPMGYDGL